MNIKHNLKDNFTQAFLKAFPELGPDFQAEITQSTQMKFGHYQCNSAMKLTKTLKQPPQALAAKVIEQFQKDYPNFVQDLTVAGPGFINITLTDAYLEHCAQKMRDASHLGVEKSDPKKVVIDFSSPNIAKEMHVGHLRSTIIGESIARILAFLGHDVVRINHVGDWGTAFGMLIAYIKQYEPKVISDPDHAELSLLVQYYKKAKQMFDEDPEFKKQSQLEVVALQGGEKEALHIWHNICEISRKSYQEIYDILDIQLIERGESFYNPFLGDLVKELEEKGFIQISEGAKCLFLPGFENREGEALPFMLQKSDGGYNYATTDMAAIRHRIQDEKADWLIYVTDAGQATHFAMLFTAAQTVGWLDPKAIRVDHVPFGLVLGPDGKKFKTRSGDTEKLIDLIHTAINKAQAILNQKEKEQTRGLNPDAIREIAHVLGVNAIKYADLSSNRLHDYQFSYDRMLQFEGNTAAFLMYAYVRIHGIKRQLIEKNIAFQEAPIVLNHESERQLGLHLAQFHECLEAITEDLSPHRLCEYLYNLAEKFNQFFRDCRVIDSPEQNARLALCSLSEKVLNEGLKLLGLKVIERM